MNESLEYAYCVELGKQVNIEEAGMEYLAQQGNSTQRFSFFCPDPNCRQANGNRTQITAVNLHHVDFDYNRNNTEKFSKCPYFRLFPKQHHSISCKAIEHSSSVSNMATSSVMSSHNHEKHFKNNLLIDIFQRNQQLQATQKHSSTRQEVIKPITEVCNTTRQSDTGKNYSQNSTGLLNVLVGSYLKLKALLKNQDITYEEYLSRSLIIQGEGTRTYDSFFKKYTYASKLKNYNGVIYGNCTVRKVDSGWYLNFYDKIRLEENSPLKKVSVFIRLSDLEKYRYRNNILQILNEHSNRSGSYIQAFFIDFKFVEHEKYISIRIPDLNKLAVRVNYHES